MHKLLFLIMISLSFMLVGCADLQKQFEEITDVLIETFDNIEVKENDGVIVLQIGDETKELINLKKLYHQLSFGKMTTFDAFNLSFRKNDGNLEYRLGDGEWTILFDLTEIFKDFDLHSLYNEIFNEVKSSDDFRQLLFDLLKTYGHDLYVQYCETKVNNQLSEDDFYYMIIDEFLMKQSSIDDLYQLYVDNFGPTEYSSDDCLNLLLDYVKEEKVTDDLFYDFYLHLYPDGTLSAEEVYQVIVDYIIAKEESK